MIGAGPRRVARIGQVSMIGCPGNAGGMRLLVETLAWAVALLVAWTATLSTISVPEMVAGAVSAILCGAAAAAARRVIGQAWRPRARWAGWLPPLALAIPADTVRLLGRALPCLLRDRLAGSDRRDCARGEPVARAGGDRRDRAGGGRLRELSPPPAGEDPDLAAFRQGWGLIVLSASPGSVVVDWPPDGRAPLIHELGSGPPSLAERVTR